MSEAATQVVVPLAKPELGWRLVVMAIAALVPAAKGVSVVVALAGGPPVHGAAYVVGAAVALAVVLVLVQPLCLLGRAGTVTFGPDGARVEHPALLDEMWRVPREDIRVIVTGERKVRKRGAETLGALGQRANVAVVLKRPSPRVPVRARFFIPALLSSCRMPVPNTTVESFACCAQTSNLVALEREIKVALGMAVPGTYQPGARPEERDGDRAAEGQRSDVTK